MKIWCLVSKKTGKIVPVKISDGVSAVGYTTKKGLLEDAYDNMDVDVNKHDVVKKEVV